MGPREDPTGPAREDPLGRPGKAQRARHFEPRCRCVQWSRSDTSATWQDTWEFVTATNGGSSAIYGSDAIAGVTNFLMRKNFQGVQLDGHVYFEWPEHTPAAAHCWKLGGLRGGLCAGPPCGAQTCPGGMFTPRAASSWEDRGGPNRRACRGAMDLNRKSTAGHAGPQSKGFAVQ